MQGLILAAESAWLILAAWLLISGVIRGLNGHAVHGASLAVLGAAMAGFLLGAIAESDKRQADKH